MLNERQLQTLSPHYVVAPNYFFDELYNQIRCVTISH